MASSLSFSGKEMSTTSKPAIVAYSTSCCEYRVPERRVYNRKCPPEPTEPSCRTQSP